jgi:hypothetical protein
MDIGVALLGGSFMPELKGSDAPSAESAFDRLVSGYRLAMEMGFDYIEATAGEILALREEELDMLGDMIITGDFTLRYVNLHGKSEGS